MSEPTKSYASVFYDLRPAKQVERRMIMDGLSRLMNGGVQIREYQYTGFGSIYFVDFILFYKLIGIRRFMSVEYDQDIKKRVAFNRPFATIDIRMSPIGDVIPELSSALQHVLWLDFDNSLTSSMLQDVALASHHLSQGSLLLVTIDAEPPRGISNPSRTAGYLREQSGDYLPYDFDESWCTQSRRAETILEIAANAIRNGVTPRGHKFIPLFKFVYADGHEMVTIGGMVGSSREESVVNACDWSDAPYVRRSLTEEPYRIHVPRLTRRERLFLDQNMPADPAWKPAKFELDGDEVAAYREIHRFYPLYGELLT